MRIHLISMPAMFCLGTPIQIGCLKSYLDEKFKNSRTLKIFTHSAYLSIPLRAFHIDAFDKEKIYERYGDVLWFIILLKKFNPLNKKNIKPLLSDLIKKTDKACKTKGTKDVILKLEQAAVTFIKEDLVPRLSKKELNIIGFTITCEQIYASCFCYSYLRKHYPQYKMLFVFGGGLMSYSNVLRVFKNLNIKGLAVLGEGEVKLHHIVKVCQKYKTEDINFFIKKCSKDISDVYSLEGLTDETLSNLRPSRKLELKSIERLPLPDYTEYFNTLKMFSADQEVYTRLKDVCAILLDASRGCSYAKCDFCGLNASWCSYRKKSVKRIYDLVVAAKEKYKVRTIQFSDNIASAWVGAFCDLRAKDKNFAYDFLTAELRSIHREKFYTKISLAGFTQIQVGIEALLDSLLKKMHKGMTAIYHIESMKYSKECGITNMANLITEYPGSTCAEVNQTKKILTLIAHLGRLAISRYGLDEHSLAYSRFTCEERKKTKPDIFIKMSREISPFFAGDRLLPPPSKRLSADVLKAWSQFDKWYSGFDAKGIYLNVYRLSAGKILIKSNRFNKVEEFVYGGAEEKVYSLCHKAMKREDLRRETGLGAFKIQEILNMFVRKKLMIYLSGKYLSLAVRPKEELIHNYYSSKE